MIGEYCLCNPKQVRLYERLDAIVSDFNSWKYHDNLKERRLVDLTLFLNPRVGSMALDIIVFDSFSAKSMRVTFLADQIEDFEECIESVRNAIKDKFYLD